MRQKLIVFIFFFLLVPTQSLGADLADLMPETVGDLHRIQLVTGPDAQAEVDILHGKALSAEASVIARYARLGDASSRPAEVWVSRVESEAEARRQTGLMVHKMYENPRSPFKNPKRLEHGGLAVYRFEGMGQVHFIWFKGDLVYWVSCVSADEKALLGVFCK